MPLSAKLPTGANSKWGLGEPVREFAHVGLAWRSHGLEPLGQVYGVAEDRVVTHLAPKHPGDYPAGIHPDVEPETACFLRKLRDGLVQFGVHPQRDQQGTLRVVFLSDRSAEGDEDGVPGVLGDVSPVPLGHHGQSGDHRSNDLVEFVGAEAISERRETGKVGEDGGDESSLLELPEPRWLVA